MVVLSIDESINTFPAIDRTKEDNFEVFEEREKENDILKSLIDAIEKKFSKKEPEEIKKPKKAKKSKDIGSLVKEEKLAQGQHSRYNLMEEFFSYLGKLKTATNVYRDHFIEYAEKKEEDLVSENVKTQDMDYNEFEEIIRVKKLNDMFGAQMEQVNAVSKEKWDILHLFAQYKVLAMLRYSFSMT